MPAGHDNRETHARRVLDGLHERIGRRRFVNRMAEREVQHVDAEQMPVGNGELDGAHDVVGRALALGVENLEADEARVRRDADVLAPDQAGDVRAVPVIVGTAWRL